MLRDFHNLTVPSLGTIKVVGVEVYWDSNLENKTETINWGLVKPGSTTSITIYIKNVSNVRTNLNFFVEKWNPYEISNYLDLSWDYTGAFVNSGEVTRVKLQLTSSSDSSFITYLIYNDVTTFSLDVNFVASELLNSS